MSVQPLHIPAFRPLTRPFYMPLAFALGGVVLALSLMPITEAFLPRLLLFYVGASLAYGLMPFVRRGDELRVLRRSNDHKAAIAAFRERREPTFTRS